MKKWYNCWLAHSWMLWGKPRRAEAISYYPWSSVPIRQDTYAQTRVCKVCKKVEIRELED